jgi:hypothetical protein
MLDRIVAIHGGDGRAIDAPSVNAMAAPLISKLFALDEAGERTRKWPCAG